MIKVKGSKKSKDLKLDKKKNVLTIGRDKSNMLVIEDSRVSRSHARVEYTETRQNKTLSHAYIGSAGRRVHRCSHRLFCVCARVCSECEYIDLGSSCGSKLNGKPVLRAKLRPGDVIELGQSVLIFQVKRKKTIKDNVREFFDIRTK